MCSILFNQFSWKIRIIYLDDIIHANPLFDKFIRVDFILFYLILVTIGCQWSCKRNVEWFVKTRDSYISRSFLWSCKEIITTGHPILAFFVGYAPSLMWECFLSGKETIL